MSIHGGLKSIGPPPLEKVDTPFENKNQHILNRTFYKNKVIKLNSLKQNTFVILSLNKSNIDVYFVYILFKLSFKLKII